MSECFLCIHISFSSFITVISSLPHCQWYSCLSDILAPSLYILFVHLWLSRHHSLVADVICAVFFGRFFFILESRENTLRVIRHKKKTTEKTTTQTIAAMMNVCAHSVDAMSFELRWIHSRCAILLFSTRRSSSFGSQSIFDFFLSIFSFFEINFRFDDFRLFFWSFSIAFVSIFLCYASIRFVERSQMATNKSSKLDLIDFAIFY